MEFLYVQTPQEFLQVLTPPVRIENDHVGNTDQFHATKEVPLPYQFQDLGNDDDDAEYRESRFGRAEGQRAVDHPGRFAAVGAVEEKQATSDDSERARQ